MNTNQTKITQIRNTLSNSKNIAENEAVELISCNPDFKLLRKLSKATIFHEPGEIVLQRGVIVDTETTGIEHDKDVIIELGMIAFDYDQNTGKIYRIVGTLDEFEQPPFPIPSESIAVHGISDDMVLGCKIDDEQVAVFLKNTNIVIAHNSPFDRQFLEKRFPIFKSLSWGCSLNQIAWATEGVSSAKLDYIAFKFGFFFDAHRAEVDCRALLEILRQPLPKSGELALKTLLTSSGQRSFKVNATGAPYEARRKLKSRGYRWDNYKKVWHITVVGDEAIKREAEWLKPEIFSGNTAKLEFEILDSLTLFSGRAGKIVFKAL